MSTLFLCTTPTTLLWQFIIQWKLSSFCQGLWIATIITQEKKFRKNLVWHWLPYFPPLSCFISCPSAYYSAFFPCHSIKIKSYILRKYTFHKHHLNWFSFKFVKVVPNHSYCSCKYRHIKITLCFFLTVIFCCGEKKCFKITSKTGSIFEIKNLLPHYLQEYLASS